MQLKTSVQGPWRLLFLTFNEAVVDYGIQSCETDYGQLLRQIRTEWKPDWLFVATQESNVESSNRFHDIWSEQLCPSSTTDNAVIYSRLLTTVMGPPSFLAWTGRNGQTSVWFRRDTVPMDVDIKQYDKNQGSVLEPLPFLTGRQSAKTYEAYRHPTNGLVVQASLLRFPIEVYKSAVQTVLQVEMPGRPLLQVCHVNVHLSFSGGNAEQSYTKRVQQLLDVIRGLDLVKRYQQQYPIVIVGDFNFRNVPKTATHCGLHAASTWRKDDREVRRITGSEMTHRQLFHQCGKSVRERYRTPDGRRQIADMYELDQLVDKWTKDTLKADAMQSEFWKALGESIYREVPTCRYKEGKSDVDKRLKTLEKEEAKWLASWQKAYDREAIGEHLSASEKEQMKQDGTQMQRVRAQLTTLRVEQSKEVRPDITSAAQVWNSVGDQHMGYWKEDSVRIPSTCDQILWVFRPSPDAPKWTRDWIVPWNTGALKHSDHLALIAQFTVTNGMDKKGGEDDIKTVLSQSFSNRGNCRVRLVSYNVHGDPATGGFRDAPNMQAMMETMTKWQADILALNEVALAPYEPSVLAAAWKTESVLHALQALSPSGYHVSFAGAETPRFGNALLLRHRPSLLYDRQQVEAVWLYSDQSRGIVPRNMIVGDYQVCPGKWLAVAVLHLDHRSESARLEQLNQAFDYLAKRYSFANKQSIVGIILMGDFNALTRSDYTTTEWQALSAIRTQNQWEPLSTAVTDRLQQTGWLDLTPSSPQNKPQRTAHVLSPLYRIDYVWYHSLPLSIPTLPSTVSFQSTVDYAARSSDHFPLVVDLWI